MRIGRRLWVGAVFVLLSPLAAMGSPGGICNPVPAVPGVGGLPMVCAGCHGVPQSPAKVCLHRTDADTVTVSVSGGGDEAGYNLTVIGGTLTARAGSRRCADNQVTQNAVKEGEPPVSATWDVGYSATSDQVQFFLSGNAGAFVAEASDMMPTNQWTFVAGTVPAVDGADVCSTVP